MRIEILGVGFDNITMEQAVAEGVRLINTPGAHYAVTPNPEIVEVCRTDPEAMEAVRNADLVLADGIGIIYGAKLLGTPLKGRVTGIGFAQGLMGEMAQNGKSLFLLGAKPGVAEKAADKLRAAYPGLQIAGTRDGYFQEDGPVLEEIRASGADVAFVCLGAPKQEKWMRKNGAASGARLLVGLGGCLDVFSGEVQRAPEIFQRLGLEWFYRLVKYPSRFGRMMKLPLFLLHTTGGGRPWGGYCLCVGARTARARRPRPVCWPRGSRRRASPSMRSTFHATATPSQSLPGSISTARWGPAPATSAPTPPPPCTPWTATPPTRRTGGGYTPPAG